MPSMRPSALAVAIALHGALIAFVVSDALEKVYTRHRAVVRSVTGIYGAAYEGDEGFERIRRDVEAFAAEEA